MKEVTGLDLKQTVACVPTSTTLRARVTVACSAAARASLARGAYILRHIAFSARTYCSPRTRKISGMASRYCIAHRFVCRCGSDMVAWPEADRVFGSYSRHGRRGDPVALMVCGRCFSLAVAKISVGQLTVAETRAALRGAVP